MEDRSRLARMRRAPVVRADDAEGLGGGGAADGGAATPGVRAPGPGVPSSTPPALVGGGRGGGMARGIGALNLRTVGTIFTSWVVTLPAGALLSILFFFFFQGLFGA